MKIQQPNSLEIIIPQLKLKIIKKLIKYDKKGIEMNYKRLIET